MEIKHKFFSMDHTKFYKFFAILLIVLFSFPILLSISYIVPGSDDFCNAFNIEKLREENSYLYSAFLYSISFYMNWQGTYFGAFFIGLYPNVHNSYYCLRVILFVCFILFVCGTFFYVLIFCKRILKLSESSSYVIVTTLVILTLNTTNGCEWFSWYSGCSVYQLPMISYLYSLIFLLSFYKRKHYCLMIISIFLSFLAAGGTLALTSFGSSLLLFTTLFLIDKNKLIAKNNIVLFFPFFTSVLGGVVNILAPGNLIRHSVIEPSGEFHIFRALMYSILSFLKHLIFLNNFSFLIFLGIIFIVIYKKESIKISIKQLTLFATLGFFSVIFVAFPILLGYSSNGIDTISRTAYTFDLAIIFYSMFITGVFASYIRKNELLEKLFFVFSKLNHFSILIILVFTIVFLYLGLKNGYSFRTFKDLKHGYIQEATTSLAKVYSELSKSKNLNAVLSIKPIRSSTIYIPEISEDPKYWINTCTSRYFGAKSCSIKIE